MIKKHVAGIALAAICFASSSFCQTTDRDQALNLFRQERWSEAASAFEALEKQQPGQTDALLYRGKCLVNLRQFKDAAEALQAYIASHPQSDNAVYLLAYVLFREDKPKESLQWFTDAAKLRTPTSDDLKIVSFDYVLLNRLRRCRSLSRNRSAKWIPTTWTRDTTSAVSVTSRIGWTTRLPPSAKFWGAIPAT